MLIQKSSFISNFCTKIFVFFVFFLKKMSATKEIRMERYFNRAQNRLHAERRHEERGTKASISCWFDIPRMHRPFYENGIPSSFFIFLLFPSLTLPFYRHPTGLFLQPPPSSLHPILLPVHWKPNGNCVSRNSFFPLPTLGFASCNDHVHCYRISSILFFLHANINARNW